MALYRSRAAPADANGLDETETEAEPIMLAVSSLTELSSYEMTHHDRSREREI